MSPKRSGAMTAVLLAAACLTAFADPPRKHNGTGTVSESSSLQSSTAPAPTALQDDGPADTNQPLRVNGRNGSHSMHPNAPVATEQFAADEVSAVQPTSEEYHNAAGNH